MKQYDEMTIGSDVGYFQIEYFTSDVTSIHLREDGYEVGFKLNGIHAVELRDFLIRNYPIEEKKD